MGKVAARRLGEVLSLLVCRAPHRIYAAASFITRYTCSLVTIAPRTSNKTIPLRTRVCTTAFASHSDSICADAYFWPRSAQSDYTSPTLQCASSAAAVATKNTSSSVFIVVLILLFILRSVLAQKIRDFNLSPTSPPYTSPTPYPAA